MLRKCYQMSQTEVTIILKLLNYLIFYRAKFQLMLHKPKDALEDVLKVLKWRPNDFDGLCIHANIFHQLGQFERSLLVWHRVKKIRPRCNLVRVDRANSLSDPIGVDRANSLSDPIGVDRANFLSDPIYFGRLRSQLRASRTELLPVYKIALIQMISKFWSR